MVRNRLLVGTAAAVLASGIGGCAGGKKAIVPVQGPVLTKEYPTTVDVDNWRGSVLIEADPTAQAPSVRAITTKAGKVPHGTDVKTSVPATATASFVGGRPVLRVATKPPEGELDVTTEVRVSVPRLAGASVRNSGGTVEISGVAGPVAVENGAPGKPGGDVIVWTGEAITDPVTLSTSKGHVLFQAGPGTSGQFDLSTDKGRAEFSSLRGDVMNAHPEGQRYRGVLDGGTNPIALHTGWGNVLARVMPNAGTYVPNAYTGDFQWPSSPDWLRKMGETMELREKDAP
jgi:hypothetical protein